MRGILALCAALLSTTVYAAPSCQSVVVQLNTRLHPGVDVAELTQILTALNATHNLPNKFVTKRDAVSMGWQRGHDLWDVPALRGKSIGGDRFSNYERQLPRGQWREADLDYHGGHRGAKRLIFSSIGQRFVSVDHYQTYIEVPACL